MSISTDKNRFSRLEIFLIVGLLTVIVWNIVNRIFSSPFDFDEGVGLSLTKNILQTGKYATFDSIFDPIVTVGPTVYFPAALLLIFGNQFLPRLAILIYSILLIYIVFSKYFKNSLSKITYISLLCLTPYFYYFSAHVLGEIPAIFFSLTGLYFLSNKLYFQSGIFLMLSIVTKNIFILSFVPALYLLYLQKKEITFKKLFHFVSPFFIIGGMWEVYRLASFNFSLSNYFANIHELIRYNRTLTRTHYEYFFGRLDMLSGSFNLNGVLMLLSMTFLSFYSFFKSKSHLIKSIALFTLIYFCYYFIPGPTVWYRHFFPSFMLFIILLADQLSEIKITSPAVILFAITLIISIIFPINKSKYLYQQNLLPLFDQVGDKPLSKSDILNQQLETANFISTQIPNKKLSGVVWYNAPEISYLTGKQIFRTPEDSDVSYLISHPFGRLLVPSVDARISEYPSKKIVLDTPFYKIYQKNEQPN